VPLDESFHNVHDPRVLRAIAHPVRSRILDELYAAGTLRAADVARELGIPANQASFHLRQLAKYGLIEEAPDKKRDQRDRVWRPSAERGLHIELDKMVAEPAGKAAVTVWRANSARWAHAVVEAAYRAGGDEDTLRTISDQSLKLTKDEAIELSQELDALLERWAERSRTRGDDRRTYLLYSILQPYPEVPTA
jgi:DNA-binding transcriptional ArsR family regulator